MKTFLVALCGVAIGAGSAGAATNFNKGREDVNPVNGINDTSDWDWMDSANWSTGLVPVDGDEVKFVRIDHNTPIGLDTNGANMNLPTSKLTGDYNGMLMAWYDSAHMTPNYKVGTVGGDPPDPNWLLNGVVDFTPVTPHTTLFEAAAASPTVTFNTLNYSKQHSVTFFQPVTINSTFTNGGSELYFYGPLSVTGAMNLNGRVDTQDITETHDTLSAASATLKESRNPTAMMFAPSHTGSDSAG